MQKCRNSVSTNCKKIALQLSENGTKIGRKSVKRVQKQDGNTINVNTKPSRITLKKQDLAAQT